MMLQPPYMQPMWISKSTCIIGDMTKQFTLALVQPLPLSNTPRNPSSIHLKTIVVVH
jgi:hypothetical protein